MRFRKHTPFFAIVAVLGLGLGSCGDSGSDDGDTQVRVVLQGLSTVDDAIDIMLYAGPSGTTYFFEIYGTAGPDETTFTLDVYEGIDDTGPLVYSVDFTLANSDIDAQPGEYAYGSVVATIMYNPGSWNTVTILVVWTAIPPIMGDAYVDLTFSHTPRIIVWSSVPGPAHASDGTYVEVQAQVEFFGDGTDESVTAQFYDNETAGGSLVGAPGVLTDPDTDGIWNGTVEAVGGADLLRLTAHDSEGDTYQEAVYAVPSP